MPVHLGRSGKKRDSNVDKIIHAVSSVPSYALLNLFNWESDRSTTGRNTPGVLMSVCIS